MCVIPVYIWFKWQYLPKSCFRKAQQKKYCTNKSTIISDCSVVFHAHRFKYLHDKISQLLNSQITPENVEALWTCLKRNSVVLPVIMEIYDILSNDDTKWKILYEKINDAHLHNGSSYSRFSLYLNLWEKWRHVYSYRKFDFGG